MMDQRLPPLVIERSDRRVIVKRCALDIRQRLDVARALVDAAHPASHKGDPIEGVWVAGDEPVEWVAKALADRSHQITRIRRTKDRNNQIGAFRDAPHPEGDAEIILVVGQLTPSSSDIDKSAHAQGRVENKSRKGLSGPLEIDLQRVIRKDQWLPQIVKKVAYR